MANARSPKYPRIGLEDAIDKAQLVWSKDYQAELPREVIAEHMGYGSLNGKSLGLIAAVARYGLLEGRGEKTKVTDLAVQILAHQTGDEERIAAVQEAARSPALFREIDDKFDGRSPSDQALKSYLLTRGFTLGGAEGVIRSFRETEAFVKKEAIGYTQSNDDQAEDDVVPEAQIVSPEIQATPVVAPVAMGVPTISMSDNGLEISGGTIKNIDQFKRLMRRLNAGMVMLEDDEYDDH